MSNVRLFDFYGRPARLVMNEADARALRNL